MFQYVIIHDINFIQIVAYAYFNHISLTVTVAILWHYSKAQLMYSCFIYYAKCVHDRLHSCIWWMECEMKEM
jgi:hypothetical protein